MECHDKSSKSAKYRRRFTAGGPERYRVGVQADNGLTNFSWSVALSTESGRSAAGCWRGADAARSNY